MLLNCSLFMFVFHKNYFLLTIILLLVEICIALFVNDRFVRPYLGDFLVVILLYCFARAIFNVSILQAAVAVLVFSFFIELLQYFNFVRIIELQDSKIANTILGHSFSWVDILAYVLGICFMLVCERIFKRNLYP